MPCACTQVRQSDSVTINEGRHKDKSGVVEAIWRGHLFIKARDFIDQGGFMCIRWGAGGGRHVHACQVGGAFCV